MNAKLDREALKRKLDAREDFVLVEALPRKYWAKEHLPGAVNLPHDEVERLAPELLPDKDREIVVYCADAACANSQIAAKALSALGYSRVVEYVEGKADWKAAGYPLENVRRGV